MTTTKSPLPPRPFGVYRDDTDHGRLYYTRAQLDQFGEDCYMQGLRTGRLSCPPSTGPDDMPDFFKGLFKPGGTK